MLDRLRQTHDPDVRRVQQEIEAELERMERVSPTADAARAIRAIHIEVLEVASGDGSGNTPGLTDDQTGVWFLRVLAFRPDLATEKQKRRMQILLMSYIAPYNRFIYKAVPAARDR